MTRYKKRISRIAVVVTAALATGMGGNGGRAAAPVDGLVVPKGFEISVYASGLDSARAMAWGDKGTLFVGSRSAGKVYALADGDGDGKAEVRWDLAEDLNAPVGVAFRDGDLYVSAVSRIYRFADIEDNLEEPGEPEVVFDGYSKNMWHGWKYIRFDPKGRLIVPVGAPCNICDREEPFASITRLDLDAKKYEVIAKGVRNTVGFDWDENGRLWFTDNGRDMMGDDLPPCELNRLDKDGQHFGYPYCHGGNIADPKYGDEAPCSEFVEPIVNFGAHTAPLGMAFYRGKAFPKEYRGDAFVAQHGSWNRSKRIGYRVMRIDMKDGEVVKSEPFVDGFLLRRDKAGEAVKVAYPERGDDPAWDRIDEETVLGRPVDVLNTPDGGLLISDDYSGRIYKVRYRP